VRAVGARIRLLLLFESLVLHEQSVTTSEADSKGTKQSHPMQKL
jgi:hypothetical protein